MGDRLDAYRAKRDEARTPEPVPEPRSVPRGADDTFVVQLHQARRLHWDLRLERSGVLVSWALPKGLPRDPKTNHLAVHTEDHPLEYAEFAGTIPAGEYGGGIVTTWDRGRYDLEKWEDDEVKVVLHGLRIRGRYVLFQTSGNDWMIHRMDPAVPSPAEPLPRFLAPMRATPGSLPADERAYGYELSWSGLRAGAYLDGGTVRLLDARGRDRIGDFAGLDRLREALPGRAAVLDGEIVALDDAARPAARLLRRGTDAPVWYMIYDLLYLDGEPLLDHPYGERRLRLAELEISGTAWQAPPYFTEDPRGVLNTALEQGFSGIVAKRINSPYLPGEHSTEWLEISDRG